IAAGRWADREPAADEPPLALPGTGRELPGGGFAVDVPDEDEGDDPERLAEEPADDLAPPPAAPPATAEPTDAGARATAPPPAAGEADTVAFRDPGDDLGPRLQRGRLGRRAFDGPGGAGMPGEPPLGRLADHLGLEGERRERFVALQRRFLAVHLEGRRERALLSAELRRELVADDPDRARIEELVGRLAEVYAASERATAEVVLASRDLLDAGQQQRYFRFLEHLRAGGPPGGGPGPGRHHRPLR
ncbi:MAG TPA: hypothetical protein VF100_06375, partial [Thermoanaerobaculia bacterium]